MSASLIQLIAELTVAASMAILVVALVRKPLRRVGGSRVAYLCWLLIPISQLVVLLPPAPSRPYGAAAPTIPQWMMNAIPAATSWDRAVGGVDYASIAVAIWSLGAVFMLFLVTRMQKVFTRSLGALIARPDGTYRSSTVRGPLLVGLWHPQVVLPVNFEELYDTEEQELVLAHERAHRDQRDQLVNAIATIWLCFAWFNPLMYWAMGRLRFDQDLARDAAVLAARSASRRRYASALLKTQLVAESGWRAPLACSWRSGHPLMERVGILKHSLPSLKRQRSALLLICALLASSSYSLWIAVPRTASAQQGLATSTAGALNDAIKALNSGNYEEAKKAIATIDLTNLAPVERSQVEMVLFNIALHDRLYDAARDHLEKAAAGLPPEQAARVRYQGTQALKTPEGK